MQPKSGKYLYDIHDAGRFILSLTNGRTIEQFVADRVVRDAVERNFITIGEAITQLTKIDPATAEEVDPNRKIVAFRNIVVHGYHGLDYEKIWGTIENHLPGLVRQIEKLLEANPPG